MSERPSRRTSRVPHPREPSREAGPGSARYDESNGPVDEITRSRRLEFARMLMGGVKPRAADIQLPPRERSTRAGPVATASAAPSPTKGAPVSSAPKPVGESSGSKLLVIEDDPVIRDMVVRVLARDNLVYQASDGAKGLALLKKLGAVDVIVCDVMMPHLDGFEFAEAAKADPILASIPILFLTARDSAKDRLEGIRVGARSYLTKPFKVKDLTLAVARAARSATVKR